jgi:hypothetical protein
MGAVGKKIKKIGVNVRETATIAEIQNILILECELEKG